jgi:small neutral amino acid transporter SnatA (MarC family)
MATTLWAYSPHAFRLSGGFCLKLIGPEMASRHKIELASWDPQKKWDKLDSTQVSWPIPALPWLLTKPRLIRTHIILENHQEYAYTCTYVLRTIIWALILNLYSTCVDLERSSKSRTHDHPPIPPWSNTILSYYRFGGGGWHNPLR